MLVLTAFVLNINCLLKSGIAGRGAMVMTSFKVVKALSAMLDYEKRCFLVGQLMERQW